MAPPRKSNVIPFRPRPRRWTRPEDYGGGAPPPRPPKPPRDWRAAAAWALIAALVALTVVWTLWG